MFDNEFENDHEQAAQQRNITESAALLGKWLWILFWLFIPGIIAGLMTNDNIVKYFPSLSLPGEILNALYLAAYGVILLKLLSQDDRYKIAGACKLLGFIWCVIAVIVTFGKQPDIVLWFSVIVAVIELVGEYYEYMAHAAVLRGFDNELSEKWIMLWKWYIGLFLAMIGSILFILVIPVIGLIATIVALIGAVAVSVLKLVYLYRTAYLFREYPVEKQTSFN